MYIFELASYLVVAILFGIGAGWLIWGDEPFEAAPAGDAPVSEQAVADLSSQIETRDQEIVRLRKRLKRMHADMDARDLHLTEVKGQSEEFQALLTQRESELQAALNGEALPDGGSEQLTRRISELEELLGASRSEADGLARKLQDAMQETEAAGTADPELAQRFADLESENAQVSESRFQLVAAHEELQRSHASISNDLAEAQARLDELSSGDNGADLAELDRVRVLEAEMTRLRTTASAAQDRVAELESAQQSLESKHQQIATALTASESRATDLQAQLAAQPDTSGDFELELAKVHAELARSRQNVNTLRQRLQDVEDENETLAGDLARATTELQGRSAKSGEAASERDQLVVVRDQLVAERDAVISERDHVIAERDQIFAQRNQILSERDQVIAERDSGQHERDQLAQTQRDLAVAQERALADNAELKSRIESTAQAADQRVAQLESQLAQSANAAAERERLERSLADLTATHESTVAQLHVELSETRLRADSAFEALHELNDEFINFRDVTLRQQSTMNSLADRLAKANSTLGSRTATPDDDSAGR